MAASTGEGGRRACRPRLRRLRVQQRQLRRPARLARRPAGLRRGPAPDDGVPGLGLPGAARRLEGHALPPRAAAVWDLPRRRARRPDGLALLAHSKRRSCRHAPTARLRPAGTLGAGEVRPRPLLGPLAGPPLRRGGPAARPGAGHAAERGGPLLARRGAHTRPLRLWPKRREPEDQRPRLPGGRGRPGPRAADQAGAACLPLPGSRRRRGARRPVRGGGVPGPSLTGGLPGSRCPLCLHACPARPHTRALASYAGIRAPMAGRAAVYI
mmetsp:Transcript_62927/g.194804  ORF Transcript_62927/g.194804 Transcript_62927/m.194804 type:complete len:269 (+) Transcript_62927:556-1362(+)